MREHTLILLRELADLFEVAVYAGSNRRSSFQERSFPSGGLGSFVLTVRNDVGLDLLLDDL